MSLDPNTLEPTHFRWRFKDGVGTITLDRPERKNPLTFDSYAELRDLFRALVTAPDVRVVVLVEELLDLGREGLLLRRELEVHRRVIIRTPGTLRPCARPRRVAPRW